MKYMLLFFAFHPTTYACQWPSKMAAVKHEYDAVLNWLVKEKEFQDYSVLSMERQVPEGTLQVRLAGGAQSEKNCVDLVLEVKDDPMCQLIGVSVLKRKAVPIKTCKVQAAPK